MSNKILQYVEVDCDYCSLTYGTNPCAANNTPSGIGSKLLLHFDGANASTIFMDSSPSARGRATVVGGAVISTAQSQFGGASGLFNGTTASINFPASTDYEWGSGDWTIDAWVRLAAFNSASPATLSMIASRSGAADYWIFFIDPTAGVPVFGILLGGAYYPTNGATAIPLNTWVHVAFVRSGGSGTMYINGVGGVPAPLPDSTSASITNGISIGSFGGGIHFFNGYIDELRITPWAVWKSNFTPPTAAYSEDPRLYNRLVLHCDGPSLSAVFPDSSVAAHGNATVSNTADCFVSTSIPKFGTGAAFFGGTNGAMTFPNSPDWDFGNSDFTIDWWEYRTNTTDNHPVLARDNTALTFQPYLLGLAGSGTVTFYSSSNGTSWDVVAALSLGTITAAVWTHRAVVRQGNTFYGYKNGVAQGSATSSLALPASVNPLSIGYWNFSGGQYFLGYVDELRISKFARFPNGTTFTPPTTSDNAPTGIIKCFNTPATCQDRLNYTNAPVTLRFAVPTHDLPKAIDCIPNVKQIQFDPATISLGQDLGQRATLTVSFDDHRHSDTGPGFDKYLSDRSYDPYKQGTFWGKFRSRQPFLRGNKIRWITGDTDQALSAMETRNYLIDSFTGPDNDGVFQIIAKDILKLADGDRSVAPNLSNGFLNAAMTNVQTTLTVLPTGVGAQYPASGFVNIGGSEIVSYTRSGDSFTIVRAQLGTAANSHSAQDRVQLVVRYNAISPDLIIADLLTTYAGVPSAYIPSAAWGTEIAAHLNRLYTATIANPTSVNDLISEVCEQAGLSVWWDDRNQQIGLLVLRGLIYSNFLFDENSTIADTLKIEEQPDKRLSQVHTYFGQINPLTSLTDSANFRSSSFIMDAQSEADYGSPAIKEIFSRWIPPLGRTIADRLGAILIGRFKDPPRKISMSVMRNSTPEIKLASGYQANGWPMQDETGALETANVQVTRLRPNADTIEIETEEVLFTAPPEDLNIRNIIVDADTYNLDLRAAHDSLYPAPTAGTTIVCTINSGVRVGSTSNGLYSFSVGSWPAGIIIILAVNGRIEGIGGVGDSINPNPKNGGHAIFARYPIKLACAGQIYGGGGGGGWGTNGAFSGGFGVSFGGGGGAGFPPGAGGAGSAGGPTGGAGTPDAGGSGNTYGGVGGGPGAAGANGIYTNGNSAGGAGGWAIDGVSYCTKGTWDGTTFVTGAITGSILGNQGN